MNRQHLVSLGRHSLAVLLLGLLATSCGKDGATGPAGPPGPPGPPGGGGEANVLGVDDPLPGLTATITSITGGTGANGNFLPGDSITANFTLKRSDNDENVAWEYISRANAIVSGPTSNYNRVLASKSYSSAVVDNGDGTFTVTLDPLPATFIAPINDTTSWTEGELTGQPLVDGTYTLGFEFRADYYVGSTRYRDPTNVQINFLLGGATTLDKRELVTQANCATCHENIRLHGGSRMDVGNCLLCHTTGSEDKNVPTAGGGTPGVLIEWKVMIHKIHAGANLAQVNGFTTDATGARDYTATPQPYLIVGHNNSVHDFSGVQFPMWPSMSNPMPRDAGYDALSSAAKGMEDAFRRGPVNCDSCHGDPDGAGPLPPPEDGALITTAVTRRGCGSCHDDWVWDRPYTSNAASMPAQSSDATCTLCHSPSGDGLAVIDAHRHPLTNPAVAEGTVFNITTIAEGGTNNNNGKLDPGEKPQVTFTVKDNANADVPISGLTRFEAVLSGPTENPNVVHQTAMPTTGLGAGPNYTTFLPEKVHLEWIGTSSATTNETFTSARFPHWTQSGFNTSVFVRTATGASSTLGMAAAVNQNYVDLSTGGGASFARDDYIVIEDTVASKEEYLRVQNVIGDRVWFSSIYSGSYSRGLAFSHAASATVQVVTLTPKVLTTDYTLNAATGAITEVTEFGTGNKVIATYTTDFVLPTVYKGTLNESPDLDSSWGDWIGLALVSGTYTLDIHAAQSLTVTVVGQDTGYYDMSKAALKSFLVGSATSIVDNERISSSDTCYKCHGDIDFHGAGRRGYESCLSCHGVAGAEDRPQYVAGGAPATTGLTIDFRTMLHKIHMGKELNKASTYTISGYGFLPFPNNFTPHTYEKIGFPIMPGGSQRCISCHGSGNDAWKAPADRDHPVGQPLPTRTWRAVCTSCHDSNSTGAHMDVNTSSSGYESCQICHGEGKEQNVERMHIVR